MAFRRSRGKSLGAQMLRLRNVFPDARCRWHRSALIFEASLQPSPTSDTYRIRLLYKLGSAPRVVVLSPKLGPIEDCPLPHTYDGERLCLYWRGEWDRNQFLADTVVPWASEWLADYETWAFTGKWLGGGTHEGTWDRPSGRGEGPKERVSSVPERP